MNTCKLTTPSKNWNTNNDVRPPFLPLLGPPQPPELCVS